MHWIGIVFMVLWRAFLTNKGAFNLQLKDPLELIVTWPKLLKGTQILTNLNTIFSWYNATTAFSSFLLVYFSGFSRSEFVYQAVCRGVPQEGLHDHHHQQEEAVPPHHTPGSSPEGTGRETGRQLLTARYNLGCRKEWICSERPVTIIPIVKCWTHARSTR